MVDINFGLPSFVYGRRREECLNRYCPSLVEGPLTFPLYVQKPVNNFTAVFVHRLRLVYPEISQIITNCIGVFHCLYFFMVQSRRIVIRFLSLWMSYSTCWTREHVMDMVIWSCNLLCPRNSNRWGVNLLYSFLVWTFKLPLFSIRTNGLFFIVKIRLN